MRARLGTKTTSNVLVVRIVAKDACTQTHGAMLKTGLCVRFAQRAWHGKSATVASGGAFPDVSSRAWIHKKFRAWQFAKTTRPYMLQTAINTPTQGR